MTREEQLEAALGHWQDVAAMYKVEIDKLKKQIDDMVEDQMGPDA